MVNRTEYRGPRYSMGISDPLLAGFEIRFGSLNFQATGNGYLMRITNRDELHPWRSTGPGPVTPGFKGKSECLEHMCARIKFHTCVDSVYTKTQCKSVKKVLKLYYMTECLKIVT
jgi:hypothetical protein